MGCTALLHFLCDIQCPHTVQRKVTSEKLHFLSFSQVGPYFLGTQYAILRAVSVQPSFRPRLSDRPSRTPLNRRFRLGLGHHFWPWNREKESILYDRESIPIPTFLGISPPLVW